MHLLLLPSSVSHPQSHLSFALGRAVLVEHLVVTLLGSVVVDFCCATLLVARGVTGAGFCRAMGAVEVAASVEVGRRQE